MSDIEYKRLSGEVQAVSAEGSFEAAFATLGVKDSDGDIIQPGAIRSGTPVHILPSHDMMKLPLGKGRVFEKQNKALVEGSFNLDTQSGREWHSALKFDMEHPPSIQEWSFGFKIRDAEKSDGARLLKDLEIVEVSPVIRGAGVNTGTLAVKQAFSDQLREAVERVEHVARRVGEFAAIKSQGGFSGPQREMIETLIARGDDIVLAFEGLRDSFEGRSGTKARRPLFDGVETKGWNTPTLDAYKRAWSGTAEFESLSDAPASFRTFVARHSLLGDPNADALETMAALPVVDPATGRLHAKALEAVAAGESKVEGIPESALDTARKMARRLLESEFSASRDDADVVAKAKAEAAIAKAKRAGVLS